MEKKANRLDMKESAALAAWVMAHKDDRRTYAELAAAATVELGFYVNVNNMASCWVAFNGIRHLPAAKESSETGSLQERLAAVEARLEALERAATAPSLAF